MSQFSSLPLLLSAELCLLIETTNGVVVNHLQVDLGTDEVTDVVDAILDHGRSAERKENLNMS